ncbi:HAD-superfamily hydrolase, subfamily IIA, partial [Kipferlia bialata]
AVETMHKIRELGKKVVFVTNDSTHTREQYVSKLARLGFGNHPVSSVYSVSWYTAQYLKESLGAKAGTDKVFVLGNQSLVQEIENTGLEVVQPDNTMHFDEVSRMEVDPAVRYVVVGMDHNITYSRLAQTTTYLLANPETMFIA